ncbi:hypothetical protein [Couchioplanes caeruleus]|uniref:hypothetical protein n=1 Tax=Couchioplanes caeruleus TaxID=56438 RepID=UPI001FD5DEFD|nr:hypothetical protein [Couchioplanes caeruleus]
MLCVAKAEEILCAGHDGHSWLAKAPQRSSFKDGRSLDTVVSIGEYEEVGILYKPRGELVYEVTIPVEVAVQRFADADAEAEAVEFLLGLFRACVQDAGRRWKIGMPAATGAELATSGSGDAGDRVAVRSAPQDAHRARPVVEIHVPLEPAPGVGPDEYPYPWIDDVQDIVTELDEAADGAEEFDDGEEWGEHYVFFITGPDVQTLLAVASRLATLPRVPPGAFATITDDQAGEVWGAGPRVPLPVAIP